MEHGEIEHVHPDFEGAQVEEEMLEVDVEELDDLNGEDEQAQDEATESEDDKDYTHYLEVRNILSFSNIATKFATSLAEPEMSPLNHANLFFLF